MRLKGAKWLHLTTSGIGMKMAIQTFLKCCTYFSIIMYVGLYAYVLALIAKFLADSFCLAEEIIMEL